MKIKEFAGLLRSLKDLLVEATSPMSLEEVIELYDHCGGNLDAIHDPVAKRALGYVLRANFDLSKAAETCRREYASRSISPYSVGLMGSGYAATHLEDPAFGRLLYWLDLERREAKRTTSRAASAPPVRSSARLAS